MTSPALSAPAAVGAVLLAAVLFGTTGTSQALGPDGTTPLGVGAVRLVVGGGALLLLAGSGVLRWWRTRAGLLAGLSTALYQVFFFAGVERAGVALGTLVTVGSGPVFAGLLAWALLGERPAGAWLLATGVCVSGLALLSSGGGSAGVGLALALASGLAYASYTVAAKRLLADGAAPATAMAAAFGLGGLLLVPVLLTQPLGWAASGPGVALVLYLGLGTAALAYGLFGRGLAVLPAGPVTTLVLAEPVVATALGVVLLGERLDGRGALGASLVLAGLLVQAVASARPRRRPATVLPA